MLFLEAYDPESMPVEFAFKCMKNWLRKNAQGLPDEIGLVGKLKMAMRSGWPLHFFKAPGTCILCTCPDELFACLHGADEKQKVLA